MREHSRRAKAIAEHLDAIGAPVVYPGLKSHPQYDLFGSMANEGFGFGGMLTLDCRTAECAEKTMSILQNEERFGYIAVSLGYFDTLISCSGSSTSSEIPPEDQAKMGLSPGLLRIAIGYTGSLEERIEQVERAVRKAGLI
jgi:methionine-gamma-lyase